ncbi:MAG TPA: hypothetical protein PKW95_22580 [bacterium]|nr:hypothetical protein [bacterium]
MHCWTVGGVVRWRMFRAPWRYLIFLLLSLWFAAGIDGAHAPAERLFYAQTRALARLSVDLSLDIEALELSEVLGEKTVAPERPGVALVALPFYALGRMVGKMTGDDPRDPRGLTAQLTSLAAAFAAAAAVLALMQAGLAMGLRRHSTVIMGILIAVATPLWPYGARLAPPAFGLLALAWIVFPLLRIDHEDSRVSLRWMLGVGLGLALLLDDVFLLCLPLLALWALVRLPRLIGRPGNLMAFALPLMLAGAVFAWHNHHAYGGMFDAPDGMAIHAHLLQTYLNAPLKQTTSFFSHHLWPGAKFLLVNSGPMGEALARARHLPDALRVVDFRGAFTWCPLLWLGFLGGWALGRDPDVKGVQRLLMLFFLAAIGLRGVAQEMTPPYLYDIAVTLPFWLAWLLGVGFFIEYHVLSMRGKIFKILFVAALLLFLAVAIGNATMAVARHHLGPAPRTVVNWFAAPAANEPSAAGEALAELPAVSRADYFSDLNQAVEWAAHEPASLARTLWPGANNLPLYLPLLIALGLLPALAGGLMIIVLRRRREELDEDEDEEDLPAPVTPRRRATDRREPDEEDDEDDEEDFDEPDEDEDEDEEDDEDD